jgi:putative Holliday junction resolvase
MRRFLGLDVGDKTIGVALSDELGFTAQGVKTVERRSWAHDLGELRAIITESGASLLVIGMPFNMDGSEGPRAAIARAFAARATKELGVPHALWDERLSTAEVRRVLIAANVSREKRKRVVDMLAAQVILQGYLEAHAASLEDVDP